MKTPMQPKPARITCEDIGDLARQGVERALAARQATIELSPEQVAAVGGGLASWLLAGVALRYAARAVPAFAEEQRDDRHVQTVRGSPVR